MKIIEPRSQEELKAYYYLRWLVLRQPWGQEPGSETVDDDDIAIHVMLVDEHRSTLAVGRVHLNNPTQAQIRFMAVSPDHRSIGYGEMVVKHLERRAIEKGAKQMILEAREIACGFYKKLGYKLVKKSYLLFDSIQHYQMSKDL